jgi:hypothetical protein
MFGIVAEVLVKELELPKGLEPTMNKLIGPDSHGTEK